jgi:hypothetical protein
LVRSILFQSLPCFLNSHHGGRPREWVCSIAGYFGLAKGHRLWEEIVMSQRFSCFRAVPPTGSALLLALVLGLELGCSGQSQDAAPVADGESSTDDEVRGGQSGGEGDGEFPAGTPCACLSPLMLGRVISADGCVRVEVTGGVQGASEFAVGDVLGGILMLACGGAPLAAGSDIAFQYSPGEHDECPAYRACAAANCVAPASDADPDDPSVRDTSFECNQACYDETRAECDQPAAWQRQTGRFTALELQGGLARFDWAGEMRSATVESLAAPTCVDEHAAQFELYAQSSSVDADANSSSNSGSTSVSDQRERDMATMPATAYVEPGTCAAP